MGLRRRSHCWWGGVSTGTPGTSCTAFHNMWAALGSVFVVETGERPSLGRKPTTGCCGQSPVNQRSLASKSASKYWGVCQRATGPSI